MALAGRPKNRRISNTSVIAKSHIAVRGSDSNIFADLGLPNAGPHFLRAQIVAELYRLVTVRKLTQVKAGAVMGISQPEVSRLFKGHFREYSIERLLAFVTAFDQEIEIVSRPRVAGGARKQAPIIFKSTAT